VGKREETKKPRLARDWYGTKDPAAVAALSPFLWPVAAPYVIDGKPLPLRYIEPCAGDGSLIDLLASSGPPLTCVAAYDIEPQRADICQRNCLNITPKAVDYSNADCFITNPPYEWKMLQPMLEYLPRLLPTWLLLPADMMHNKRMSPYIDICSDIVSIGRLWWFENEDGKKVKGVDNFCWYKFDFNYEGFTRFHSR
jgi:hypothetical protein